MAIRFGVGPSGLGFVDMPTLRDTVRRLEDWGFDSVCFGDHLDGRPAPGAAALAAASWTESLRVGVHVYCNDLRPPALLAQEIETIGRLTDGRFEAGLGAGWLLSDYERAGISFDPASQRVERLRTSVQTIKTALTNADCRVPLMIGGGGPKVLTLAAEEADIVGFNVKLPQGIMGDIDSASARGAAAVDKVRLVRRAAGARAFTLEFQVFVHVVDVTDDRAAGLERAATQMGLPVDAVAESPHVLVGSVGTVIERVEAIRADLGITYFCVPAAAAAGLAPVVAAFRSR